MPHPYLRPYMALIEFLSTTFGPTYEVVLHDFSEKGSSIIAIANGHISGRSIGAPLNKYSLEAISKGLHKEKDYMSDYTVLSASGKMLRSCTYFIKDGRENLIGLLSINFDDSRYQKVIKDILSLCHPDNFIEQKYIYKDEALPVPLDDPDTEKLYTSVHEVADDVLSKILEERGVSVERLTLEEKMEIISVLDEHGVFYLKGSVKDISKTLKCSQASIYRYIQKIR